MTTTPTAPTAFRPESRVSRGLAWRAAIIDLAAVAVVLDLPVWVRAPLSLAAVVVVVTFFLRRSRRRGLLDGILVTVGVGVVLLMLLGAGLNLLPSGITGAGWGVGVGVIELAFLLALALWRPPVGVGPRPRSLRRPPTAAVVWTVLIAAVLTTALVWSVSSFSSTHIAPLALGMVTSADSSIVTVTSGRDQGPYELRSVSSAGTVTVLFDGIRVGPQHSASFQIVTPKNTRATLQLAKSGSSSSVRELIIDTHSSTTKVSG